MTETEETIKILDKLATDTRHSYSDGKYVHNNAPGWYFHNPGCFVFSVGDKFRINWDDHHYVSPRLNGLHVLEILAEKSAGIAKKLSEPQ